MIVRTARRAAGRRGFSTTEMIVVCLLTVMLTSILGAVWRGLCLPTLDAASRCRIALEANLATASFARDFGGMLADTAGQTGGKTVGRFVGRLVPASNHLRLCFHGDGDPDMAPRWASPDTVISYVLRNDCLVRWNETSDTAVTVARHITSFQVDPLDDGSGVSIALTFAVRDISLTYQLQTLDPPTP